MGRNISGYLINDTAVSEKLPILVAPLWFFASYALNRLPLKN